MGFMRSDGQLTHECGVCKQSWVDFDIDSSCPNGCLYSWGKECVVTKQLESGPTGEKELVVKIRAAMKKVKDERGRVKCKCCGFVLQYEGKCVCSPKRQLEDAKRALWEMLESL